MLSRFYMSLAVYLVDPGHRISMSLQDLESLELSVHHKAQIAEEIQSAIDSHKNLDIDSAIVSNGTIWLDGIVNNKHILIPC